MPGTREVHKKYLLIDLSNYSDLYFLAWKYNHKIINLKIRIMDTENIVMAARLEGVVGGWVKR